MPPRPGLTLEKIAEAALKILEREGAQGLSLAKIAKQFGVKPPSLYNHVRGLDDLHRILRLRGLRELGNDLQRAAVGRAGCDALFALANAYRHYALRNPALYALTLQSTEGNDDELRQAGQRVVETVLAVLHAYDLQGDDAIHATRILRSTLHGFVTLEATGGYALAVSTDETYERLLAFLHTGLQHSFRPDANLKPGAPAKRGQRSEEESAS